MRGGARAGAGRPKGEVTKLVRIPARAGKTSRLIIVYLLSQMDKLAGGKVAFSSFTDGVITTTTGKSFGLEVQKND